MAKIAFILLCHKDPGAVVEQAMRLTATGDCISIHYDKSADPAGFREIQSQLADNPNVVLVRRRVKCGWGEWSLVEATLRAVRAALDAFPKATHFYMLSGDCMPIKTSEYIQEFLAEQDADFIESHDFFESDWIKTGMKEDRLIYRHFVNERGRKDLFYRLYNLQKRFGMSREIPKDIQVHIGSQWWCLRRPTMEKLMDLVRERRDLVRFFKFTWIPDETFFQTLIRLVVPAEEIESRTLTFLMFTDYGMPLVFYNDHYDMLINQNFLFARKISPEADELKARLGDLYAAKGVSFEISDEGPGLFKFVTERGRISRRYGNRFWEVETTLGRDRELMIVVCKKWHVAKRVLAKIKQVTNVPAVEFLFQEEDTELPDLGGIQSTVAKRHRHRRALLRMMFDYFQTNRMIICMDPQGLELLKDFYADRSTTRALEIQCNYSDDYLKGHAARIGLAGESTPKDTFERILPTIRRGIDDESDAIRDARFENYHYIREQDEFDDFLDPLQAFLSVSQDQARDIAATPHMFAD
ncbi:DUF5928 domain-containing protein [Cognatishimia sp. D5M38]|uniref:Peptide O-xylosyltransferase n=1 Tax=Cognatishimia coralii TaxID=3083254 RepID=A0ABU8QJV4_9RHOB